MCRPYSCVGEWIDICFTEQYFWVEGENSEVELQLHNPLPFELTIDGLVSGTREIIGTNMGLFRGFCGFKPPKYITFIKS